MNCVGSVKFISSLLRGSSTVARAKQRSESRPTTSTSCCILLLTTWTTTTTSNNTRWNLLLVISQKHSLTSSIVLHFLHDFSFYTCRHRHTPSADAHVLTAIQHALWSTLQHTHRTSAHRNCTSDEWNHFTDVADCKTEPRRCLVMRQRWCTSDNNTATLQAIAAA